MNVQPLHESSSVRGACPHDCPDRCAWVLRVEDGVATSLVGDRQHPETRGVLCAKVDHYVERAYSPLRVLYPLRRTGAKGDGSFERVSWEEALDAIAARLRAIVDESGATAILPYSFAGTQGLLQANGMGRRFFSRLGASRLDRTVCGTAGGAGLEATIGTSAGMLPRDLEHSKFIVLWGTNPIVTNLHLWPVIREARRRGATVVVIDPLKTRTAAAVDWHVRPLPGSDAALALAMMHVIVSEHLHDEQYGLRAHRRLRGAAGADRRLSTRARGRVDRAGSIGDRRPRACLRNHAAGGDPGADRAGAPRRRRDDLPRDRLPAGARGGVAGARRRACASPLAAVRRGAALRADARAGEPEYAVAQHAATRPRADRLGARPADPGSLRLFEQPGGHRTQPEPRARRAAPGRSVHGRARAVHDRYRPSRRLRAAGDEPTGALGPDDLVGAYVLDAQPSCDRSPRRGDLGHRALPAARAQARLRRDISAGLRRGDDPLRALERPPVPGRDQLRASASRRVGAAGAARAVAAARRRSLPDAVGQVRVLFAASPTAASTRSPTTARRVRTPTMHVSR